jgi:ABC-2 type transport system ATP-binding protein
MNNVIQTIQLSKKFRNISVLDKVDLCVPEGAIYGLLGPNGAGKSTTLQILMNIHQASGGRAEIFGHDSQKISPRDFTQIGYIAESQELPGWMTVEGYMAYLEPFYPNWDRARATELLREFDLPPKRKLRHLSRGMHMKATLASSLAYRPRLIVMDEPFSGLDSLVRDEVVESLLVNAEGASILICSHDLAEIESFASHIGYLDRGRLQFSEETASLGERFREIEITLDSPDPVVSPAWPASWLNTKLSGRCVRFVETQFEREKTMAEIGRFFPKIEQVALNVMPLRSIFVTLAKASRKAA